MYGEKTIECNFYEKNLDYRQDNFWNINGLITFIILFLRTCKCKKKKKKDFWNQNSLRKRYDEAIEIQD